MTASELPAKWGADRGVDDVVCRVEEGRTAAARRRRRGNQEEWNSKMADSTRPIRFRSSKDSSKNIQGHNNNKGLPNNNKGLALLTLHSSSLQTTACFFA